MKKCFVPADILLPDFDKTDGSRWAVVACDQFTSQPEYWEAARKYIGSAPSALDLILPEAYLGREDELLPVIALHMKSYMRDILKEYKNTFIYVERTQSDGRVRRGLVGAVDLECYDWRADSCTPVRATEGTVPERIPPRVRIRRAAEIELPHIMLLLDDPDRSIIEPLTAKKADMKPAYDFDLMSGGGHIAAWFPDGFEADRITRALGALSAADSAERKYGVCGGAPLAIAVGDGNHSLATAKAVYEQLKAEIGSEAALAHPARYALAELVNIHEEALDFEPIYRIVTGTEPEALIGALRGYASSLKGTAPEQRIECVYGGERTGIIIEHPEHQLTVGTLQRFLDSFISQTPGAGTDYIHGEENVKALSEKPMTTGFIFEGMAKDALFRSVICDGPLPRKTFSMGHAEDKRYYIEARKIVGNRKAE